MIPLERLRELLDAGGATLVAILLVSALAWAQAAAIALRMWRDRRETPLAGRRDGEGRGGRDFGPELRARDERRGRGLAFLGSVATATPLLGLLGTVVGMIQSFAGAAFDEGRDPIALGRGIETALVTTQAGLVFGLPLLLVHGVLSSRVRRARERDELRVRRLASGGEFAS